MGSLYGRRDKVEKWARRNGARVLLAPLRLIEYGSEPGERRGLFDEAAFYVEKPENLAFTVRNAFLKKKVVEAEPWLGTILEGSERSNKDLIGLYARMVSEVRRELSGLYMAKVEHARATAKSMAAQMFFGARRINPGLEEAAARASALEFLLSLFEKELGFSSEPSYVSEDVERIYMPIAVVESGGVVIYELVDKPRKSGVLNALYSRDPGYRKWIRKNAGLNSYE